MKLPLSFLIAAVVVAAPMVQSADEPSTAPPAAAAFKAHVLSREELDKLIAQPGKVLFVDVRRPDEVSSIGGLPVYLSVQPEDVEKDLAWIPKDRLIVTLSNHAARAGKVADVLAAKGFKVAGAAGVQLYEKDGGTLTKIAVPEKKAASTDARPSAPW